MSKFKIGDRVKAIAKCCNNTMIINQIGTIIDINSLGNNLVKFDNFVGGHNGGGAGKPGYHWWCNNDVLEHTDISDKIVITTDGKITTAKMYSGKNVVKSAIATCSPDDKFDFETGAKIVFERLNAFDWTNFKSGKFAVSFASKQEYVEFLRLCTIQSLRWRSGLVPTMRKNLYFENMGIMCENEELVFSDIETTPVNIFPFSDYFRVPRIENEKRIKIFESTFKQMLNAVYGSMENDNESV